MANSGKSIIFLITGLIFIPPCLFFTYYTARLLYVNLTMEDAVAHRTSGMLIGAAAFPLAAIAFGAISWFCIKRSRLK
jgi:hypothetical protein